MTSLLNWQWKPWTLDRLLALKEGLKSWAVPVTSSCGEKDTKLPKKRKKQKVRRPSRKIRLNECGFECFGLKINWQMGAFRRKAFNDCNSREMQESNWSLLHYQQCKDSCWFMNVQCTWRTLVPCYGDCPTWKRVSYTKGWLLHVLLLLEGAKLTMSTSQPFANSADIILFILLTRNSHNSAKNCAIRHYWVWIIKKCTNHPFWPTFIQGQDLAAS